MSRRSVLSVAPCSICSGSGRRGIFGHRGLGIIGRVCRKCGGSGEDADFGSQSLEWLQPGLAPGAIIRIHGVRTRAELNGQEAVLHELVDRDMGLWHVQFADGKIKQIGAKNLELVGVPPVGSSWQEAPAPDVNASVASASASVFQDDSPQVAGRLSMASSKEVLGQGELAFKQGMRVRLHDVKGRPEMNGKIGIFDRLHEGRCVVRLDEGSKMFFPANVLLADSFPASSSRMFSAEDSVPASSTPPPLDQAPASAATPDEVAVPLPTDLLRAASRGSLVSALQSGPQGAAASDSDQIPAVVTIRERAASRGSLVSALQSGPQDAATSDSVQTPAVVTIRDAVLASGGSVADLLKKAARGSLNSALQHRPRDVRIMRSALKLAQSANLSEAELLPMTEALAAEETKARLEGHDVQVAPRERAMTWHVAPRELPPEGSVSVAGCSTDQNFDVVD